MSPPEPITPMMAQYLEARAAWPGALLFWRMGDFYELFFEDAAAASAALGIALTHRGKHLGADIPMCGVPVHAAETYLLTLIRKGFRVAIGEQTEDPAAARTRGAKSVVRRQVVRLVTPGTLTEEALLAPGASNWLAALAVVRGEAALAWADISTGEFRVAPLGPGDLPRLVARIGPAELLHADDAAPGGLGPEGPRLTGLPARGFFDSESAKTRLAAFYGTASLEGFGAFTRAELAAMGALFAYLDLTGSGRLPALAPPRREAPGAVLGLDAATRRNLELTRTLEGKRAGSLLAVLDHTVTGAGARLLEQRLGEPLTDAAAIGARLDEVDWALRAPAGLRRILSEAPDMARALMRLSLERGGPRDLGALRAGLGAAGRIAGTLTGVLPDAVAAARAALTGLEALAAELEAALAPDLPLRLADGGLVREGFDAGLDTLRALARDTRGAIAALQADYAVRAGVGSLKIRHNNVLGYFAEVPDNHGAKLLAGDNAVFFIHRQTTANTMRFTTAELSALESRILNAAGAALAAERAVFLRLSAAVLAQGARIAAAAGALAALDVALALAEAARQGNWCRPVIARDRRFLVSGGRHPVVEAALRAAGGAFTGNDCDLGPEGRRLWLMTGPNMAGKSTFLRQNALIAILAQAGSYVPAVSAEIGIADQVFSRVGAGDDLARGKSTFMSEMLETAAILNQAGPDSLVILDEIGRGTATWDGLSIAWAVLEHLHDVTGCRGLFATHYHELTQLTGRLPALKAATLKVREWEGEILFLHEVAEGAAEGSYGVQVARLAGLPAGVTDRAREVLAALEKGEREGTRRGMLDELPLFAARPPAPGPATGPAAAGRGSAVEAALAGIAPDALTPRAALDLIYELKALAKPQ
jgi:DNA mismatch repair protein MutS